MTASVTHSTPADANFGAGGAAAWNAAHVVVIACADLSNVTATGVAVMTAADAAAARAAVGAGVSSFSGAYVDLTGKPTLGTAAATAITDYATAAQGATADAALQPAGNGGALTGLTKAQVGLANADNTSDAGKPVSTAQQAALDLKANLVSPTFTGTVGGVTAAMVGAPSGSGTSTGANTGDQTSIVGITGTIAQFNTAITDGDLATGGGTATGTNTGDNATNTQYSGLAASKQDTLVSATNIKTVNGSTLLGAGDLAVAAGDPSSVLTATSTILANTQRVLAKLFINDGGGALVIEDTGTLVMI